MKKRNLTWFFLTAFLACGLWVPAAEQDSEPKPQTFPARQLRMGQQPRPRARISMTDPNMRERYRADRQTLEEQAAREARDPFLLQEKKHQELIEQLTEIRNMAEEEGASKTARAIQELIDKRKEEYKNNTEEMQKRRLEMQQRIQQRMNRRTRQTGSSAAAVEKASEPEEQKQETSQDTPRKKNPEK